MTVILLSYVIALVLFAALDIVWLSQMGPAFYKPALGDVLAPEVRIAPALAFYLLYPIGLVVFAILPALKSDSVATALALGALFGLLTYATYDLTNYATLRNWSWQLTAIDMIYGSVVGAGVSAVTCVMAPALARWLGLSS